MNICKSESGFFEITLPPDWKRVERHASYVEGFRWDASPAGENNVVIGRIVKSRPADGEVALWAKTMLEAPPHELSSSEIKQLRWFVSGSSLPTSGEFLHAKTDVFGGITCIQYESRGQNSDARILLVLADPFLSGSCMNQFFFFAPASLYDQYLPIAQTAFASIRPEPVPDDI